MHADAQARVRRLVEARGMSEVDARARIDAQASDDARSAAADVVLDNGGPPEALHAAVDALWHRRLVPFEANLRTGHPVLVPPHLVEPDPRWAADGAQLGSRVARAGGRARDVAHVGPTAVPGLPAVDVVDLQLAVDPEQAGPAAVEAIRVRPRRRRLSPDGRRR